MSDKDTDIEWLKKGFSELNRRVDKGFHDMSESLREIRELYVNTFETKTDATKKFDRIDHELSRKAEKKDLDNVEETIRWIARLVIGAVVGALLGLVLYSTNLI